MKKLLKNKKPSPTVSWEDLNLSPIKSAIAKSYGSAYAYAKAFELSECEVSLFLNKKRPISFRTLQKHANNLGLKVAIRISK